MLIYRTYNYCVALMTMVISIPKTIKGKPFLVVMIISCFVLLRYLMLWRNGYAYEKVFRTGELDKKNCPDLLPNITNNENDYWNTVITHENVIMYTYSAYYDNTTTNPEVKIMGISTLPQKTENLFCQIWFIQRNYAMLHLSEVDYYPASNPGDYKFTEYVYSCSIPTDWVHLIPTYVSIVSEKCQKTTNVLTIHKPTKPLYNFTVCLSPINRKYAKLGQFLEFIEVNSMFGATHFILYNESIGDILDPFIEMYKKEGIAEVVEWKLPIETKQGPTNEIHYFGQSLAINDCLYKAKLHSTYAVFIDLDEIIVTKEHTKWSDYIRSIKNNYGAYVFRNVFFLEQLGADETYAKHPIVRKIQLHTLLYSKREVKTWKHYERSKYIVETKRVSVVGVHLPFKYNQGYNGYLVPESEGALYHYRNWEKNEIVPFFLEKTMFKFKDEIIKRIEHRLLEAKSFGYKDN